MPVTAPLRKTDKPVVLDLQPLIDQCHQRGRYHLLRYDLPLVPPLSESDESWMRQTLRQHGLIS